MITVVGRRRLRAMLVLAIVLFVLTWMPGQAFSVWTVGTPIVTYFAGPELTGSSSQQMLDGGWNLVWANTISQLNVAQDRGLRAMWTGPLDDATVSQIRSSPALYSYFLTDEPSTAQFSDLASSVAHLRTLDPNRMAYINLFPNDASDAQLGTAGYQQYLSQYMSTVQPSLLSYDNYQFYTGSDAPDYFKNLAIISHTAKQAGIPFLNIIQACSWDPVIRVPTTNELRYLTYTTMAYGGQGVSHFVYSAPGFTLGGGMAQADGTPTPLYDAAKSINPEFVAIARQVQSLHWIGAYHLGDLPWGFDTTDGSSPMRLPGNSPFSISPGVANSDYVTDAPVKGMLMGLFGAVDQLISATCALVVNLNYTEGIRKIVTGPGNLSIFNPTTGLWSATGQPSVTLTLGPGGGTLVALTAAIPVQPPPAWNLNGGGNWLAPGNWSNFAIPNFVDAEACFYGVITSAHTVYADTPVTAGTLRFDNTNKYVLGGAGSLTLQVSTGSALIDVQAGSHKINLPLIFASNSNINVAGGATLTIGNPATINANKTVTKIGNVVLEAPLTILSGGVLQIVSGPTTLFGAPSLGANAKIDVMSNSMTIDHRGQSSSAAMIKSQLVSGYAAGAWNGSGIGTSAGTHDLGLGWKDDPTSQSILVKYVYYGDANLDGTVDTSDFTFLASNFGGSAKTWSQADFNYDGSVDTVDFTLLASNFGQVLPAHTVATAQLLGASVPEPATLSALAAVSTLLIGRRKRCLYNGLPRLHLPTMIVFAGNECVCPGCVPAC